MKRFFDIKLILLLVVLLTANIFYGCTTVTVDKVCANNLDAKILNYNDVKDSLIRFHVIANSDSDEDQQLKLKVKNKVIEYLYPYLSESKSLDDSRQIIKDNMDEVKTLTQEVIKEEGYNYDVNLQLSRENFPDKSYGNIVLPQGNYEAFRIIIGKGKGRNWWCVMFPPLCFVDESKNIVDTKKLDENIANIEGKTEENKKDNDKQVIFKFKVVEVFDKIFN